MKNQLILPAVGLLGLSAILFTSASRPDEHETRLALPVVQVDPSLTAEMATRGLPSQLVEERRGLDRSSASDGDGHDDSGGVLHPSPGRSFRHSLSADYLSSLDVAGQQQGTEMSLTGELVVSVRGESPEGLLLGLRVEQAALAMRANGEALGAEQQAALKELSALLGDESLVHLSLEGRVLGVQLAAGVDPNAAYWVRSLAANLQLVRPVGESGSWQAEEQAPMGVAVVEYREMESGVAGVREFTKRCGQISGDSSDERFALAMDVSGAGRLLVDESDGWYRSLSYDEETTVVMEGEGFQTTVKGVVRMERIAVEECQVLTDVEITELLARSWSRLTPPKSAGGIASGRDPRQRGEAEANLDSILAEIEALVASGEIGSYELYAARRRLAGLVARRPGVLAQLRRVLKSGSYDATTASVAVGAVGESGAADALDWLSKLAGDADASDELRLSSVVSLSQIEAPTPEVLALLSGLATDSGVHGELSSSALLVLGAMTRHDDSGLGMESLLGLEGLAEERGLRPWLLALGNAGTPAAAEAALEHLASPDAGVRAAALKATLALGPELASEHGAAALHDPDPSVRAAGAQLAYGNAGVDEITAFGQHLSVEPNVIVREEAYRALAARPDGVGYGLLNESLGNEANADLHALLVELLQTV